jgi:hypothetical protein
MPFAIHRHNVAFDVTLLERDDLATLEEAVAEADRLEAAHEPRYEFSVWLILRDERGAGGDLRLVPPQRGLAEHLEACARAGCTHPPYYAWGSWGYCALCRAVEFEGQKKTD